MCRSAISRMLSIGAVAALLLSAQTTTERLNLLVEEAAGAATIKTAIGVTRLDT